MVFNRHGAEGPFFFFFVNQVTAAEKRLEAPLQTGKAAGFLGVIHNEGLR